MVEVVLREGGAKTTPPHNILAIRNSSSEFLTIIYLRDAPVKDVEVPRSTSRVLTIREIIGSIRPCWYNIVISVEMKKPR